MLTSFPYEYPLSKNNKRALVDSECYRSKRAKRLDPHEHNPIFASYPLAQPATVPSLQFSSDTTGSSVSETLDPCYVSTAKEKDNEMMVDDMRSHCERIDDMEKYLKGEEERKDDPDLERSIDIYSLLQQRHRPLTATIINGVLLPMERLEGGTKHRIPEFVLRSPASPSTRWHSSSRKNIMNVMRTDSESALSDSSLMAMDID